MTAIPSGCERLPHHGFGCTSLMTDDAEHLPICLLATVPVALSHAYVLAARALCCSARGTSLVAPWHVGSSFPNEGLNLRPLHWTTRKTPIIHLCMYILSGWMSIQTLCPLDDFLWLSCKNSFYNIPDTSPDQIYFWSTNTSSYPVGCLLPFLMMSYEATDILEFNDSVFLFCCHI